MRSRQSRAEACAGRVRIIPTAVASLGPVDRYRALALATIGEEDAALKAVAAAHQLAVDRCSPLWAARCALDHARLLGRRHLAEDRDQIDDLLRSAETIGRRHGSRLVERLAGEIRDSLA